MRGPIHKRTQNRCMKSRVSEYTDTYKHLHRWLRAAMDAPIDYSHSTIRYWNAHCLGRDVGMAGLEPCAEPSDHYLTFIALGSNSDPLSNGDPLALVLGGGFDIDNVTSVVLRFLVARPPPAM